jgi:hypothetical protein
VLCFASVPLDEMSDRVATSGGIWMEVTAANDMCCSIYG